MGYYTKFNKFNHQIKHSQYIHYYAMNEECVKLFFTNTIYKIFYYIYVFTYLPITFKELYDIDIIKECVKVLILFCLFKGCSI